MCLHFLEVRNKLSHLCVILSHQCANEVFEFGPHIVLYTALPQFVHVNLLCHPVLAAML